MVSDKRFNDVPVETVAEVAAFEEVKARLRAFRESNPAFFKYLEPLIEEYNTKQEAAEKVVRAKQVSCGDFHQYQRYVQYDTKALRDALGRDAFLAVGGSETTVTKYDIDKTRFEVAAKSGQVPQNVLQQATKVTTRYHMPEKIKLP